MQVIKIIIIFSVRYQIIHGAGGTDFLTLCVHLVVIFPTIVLSLGGLNDVAICFHHTYMYRAYAHNVTKQQKITSITIILSLSTGAARSFHFWPIFTKVPS